MDPDLDREGEWETEFPEGVFQDLAREAEELGIHYALLKGQRSSPEDPYLEVLQGFHRFMTVLKKAFFKTVMNRWKP